jgi:hypothetical protein
MAYLVKTTSHVNRTGLDDSIDYLGQRGQEVRGIDLWVEEDLRGQKSLVTNIQIVSLCRGTSFVSVWCKPLYDDLRELTLPVTLCSPANLAKYL